MRRVDPARLASGDVCDVEVVLTLKDGTEVSGLATGGTGDAVDVGTSPGSFRRVPLDSVASARRK